MNLVVLALGRFAVAWSAASSSALSERQLVRASGAVLIVATAATAVEAVA